MERPKPMDPPVQRTGRSEWRADRDSRPEDVRVARPERIGGPNAGQDAVRNWRDGRTARPERTGSADDGLDSVRNWRGRRTERGVEPSVVGGDARPRGVWTGRSANPTESGWDERVRRRRAPPEGAQPPVRVGRDGRDSPGRHWRGDWRSDRRYDWRNHRDRNRSTFHVGVYFDPFGWSYRRYNVGYRLWPDYYSSNYWINDPWMYRLPPAYPGTRWIRYHDDALLVDTWSGEVIDVIYDFFW